MRDHVRRAAQDMRLKRAIRWVSDRLQRRPGADRWMLADEASREFGLSPPQEEFLYHMYLEVVWEAAETA